MGVSIDSECQDASAATIETMEAACAPLSVAELARTHHDDLLRFLRRRISAGAVDPEDVAQEAYVRMLRYEGERGIRTPYFLLLRVAANVLQDQYRANLVRRSGQHRPLGALELACGASDPERSAVHAEELDRVLEAINGLTPRCREVFLRHRFTQVGYPQIARQFGISVKMVEKYISTALSRCAERVAAV